MSRTQWFVRRPHVTDRMKKYARYPWNADNAKIEAELRQQLDEAAKNQEKTFLQGCKPGQFAVRIAVPGRDVVYAILKKPDSDKTYDWIVPTVLSVDMYQTWSTDGKLGAIEDLPPEKRSMPKLKPQLCLRWSNGDGKEHWGDYCADDVPQQIRKLIGQGVGRDAIKVYKEIPFKIEVSLEGITS